jgi:hypothetical protein
VGVGALQRLLALAFLDDPLGGRSVSAHGTAGLAAFCLLAKEQGDRFGHVSDGDALGGGDEVLVCG